MPNYSLLVMVLAATMVFKAAMVTSGRDVRGTWRMLQKNEDCVKTGPCSCRAPGGVIDLSPLADNFTAKFKDIPDTQGAALYSWNPCLTFTEDNCVDVAACQLYPGPNATSHAIGSQGTARFVHNERGDLTLQYTYPDPSGVDRTTIVTLTCVPNGDNENAVGSLSEFPYSDVAVLLCQK